MLLAIAVCPLWVPHWWESNRNKLSCPPRSACRSSVSTSSGTRARSWPHGRGVRLVHHPARRALRDLRAASSCAATWRRRPHNTAFLALGRAGVVHRHDRRLDAADPPAPPDQPRAPASAHGRLLHLPRVQHRRHADAARRPAAVPRLPRGRPVHLDLPALAALGSWWPCCWPRTSSGTTRSTPARRSPRSRDRRRSSRCASRAGSTSCGSGCGARVAFLHAPWREAAIVALAALSLWRRRARPARQRLHGLSHRRGRRALRGIFPR